MKESYVFEASGISVKVTQWRDGAKALIEKITRTEGTNPIDFEVRVRPNGSKHIIENYSYIDGNGQTTYGKKDWGPVTITPIEE